MSKKNCRIFSADGVTVLELGEMEIWDGADMALMRETLTRLVKSDKCRAFGISMQHVKYIPSGFFGMLFDWYEQGIRVQLLTPQPHVQQMLWFHRFFHAVAVNRYELRADADTVAPPGFSAPGAFIPAVSLAAPAYTPKELAGVGPA